MNECLNECDTPTVGRVTLFAPQLSVLCISPFPLKGIAGLGEALAQPCLKVASIARADSCLCQSK